MRSLIAKLLGWKVVWLLHFDGEVSVRLAQPTPFGLVAFTHSRLWKIGRCLLLADGKLKGACYVDSWHPYSQVDGSGDANGG